MSIFSSIYSAKFVFILASSGFFLLPSFFNISEFLHLQLNLSDEDFYLTEDIDEPFNKIDIGKAEASFISI